MSVSVPTASHGVLTSEGFSLRLQQSLVLAVVVIPFAALIIAIWQLWDRYVTLQDILLLVGLYVPIAFGVTAGFHRMLTHRSFKAHPVVQGALLILGSMAVEGPAIQWAADHLKHHARSDQDGDPHSPLEGLWHSHMGWLFSPYHADPNVYGKFLLRDPLVVFVDRTFVLWVTLSLVIPFILGGWQGLLWGGLVRMFLVHHITWSVNSVCHTFGRRAYETTDRSRNQWTVGLLGMGEGWHNNHHAFPRSAIHRSAIHGMDRWQFDASALLIVALEKLRLVSEVVRISPEQRERKRLTSST
jgi:stearoyl-CoA desaturase (Delta-9 desaturase)